MNRKTVKNPTFEISNEEIDNYVEDMRNKTMQTSMQTSYLDLKKTSINALMDQTRDDRML